MKVVFDTLRPDLVGNKSIFLNCTQRIFCTLRKIDMTEFFYKNAGIATMYIFILEEILIPGSAVKNKLKETVACCFKRFV